MAIREELELDISSALARIEEVGAALTAITEEFRASLANAVSSLADSIPQFQIPVDVIVSSSDLGSVVASDLAENDGTDLEVSLTADEANTDALTDALQESAAQPLDLAPLNIEGELSNAEQLSLEFTEAASAGGESIVFDAELQPSIDLGPVREDIETTLGDASTVSVVAELETDVLVSDYEALVSQLGEPVQVPVEPTPGASEELDKTAESAKKAKDELNDTQVAVGAGFVAKVGGGFAAVAAAAGGFFAAAVASEGALRAFNQTLGELAPAIDRVDVNGLDISLQELAQTLGSDDEAVLAVATRFGQLGISSGAAAEDIATANNQLFAVAANIRATNPALGELDQIATRAGQAFIRGGRAAAGLGLSLTSQQIRAEAANRTGKDINDTFTQFELFAAGAALASEQFGSAVEQNIDQALQNPIIALENIQEIFANTTEELGKPLVVPVLQLLRDGIPVATGFLELVAQIGIGLLPIIQKAFEAIGPVLETVIDSLQELFDNLQPLLVNVGETVAQLISEFGPLLDSVIDIVNVFASGLVPILNPVISSLEFLIDKTGILIPLVLGLNTALLATSKLNLVFLLRYYVEGFNALATSLSAVASKAVAAIAPFTPWLLIIGAVTVAIVGLYQAANQAPEAFSEIIDQTITAAAVLSDAESALRSYKNELTAFVKESEILKDAGLVESLSELGISVDTFVGFLEGGTEGLRDFLQTLARSTDEGGLLNLRDGTRYTAEEIENMTAVELEALLVHRDTTGALNTAGDAYVDYTGRIAASNEEGFNRIVVLGELDEATRNSILSTSVAANGEIDYAKALADATNAVAAQTRAEAEEEIASGRAAIALKEFGQQLNLYRQQAALGVDTTSILSEATVTFSGDAEKAKEFVDELTQEVQKFKDTVVGNVPSVIDAFGDLSREEGGSFAEISASLQQNLTDTENWSNTLVRLAEENKTGILKVAAELGPQRTAILLEGYGGDEAALNDHLQKMFEIEQTARREAEIAAAISYASFFGLTSTNYDELRNLLRLKAPFLPITQEDIDAALKYIEDNKSSFEVEGEQTGDGIRRGFNKGYEGLDAFDTDKNPLAKRVEQEGEQAKETATQQGNAAGQAYVAAAGDTAAANGAVVSAGLAGALATASTNTEFFARLIGIYTAQRIVSGFVDTLTASALVLAQTVNGVLLTVSTETAFGSQYVGFAIASGIGRGAYDNRAFIGDELVRGFTYVVENYSDEADMTGWYLGSALAEGLKRGLRDNASSVAAVAAQIIRDAEDAARTEAKSESPSRVWESIGRDLVDGLARGLERGAPVSNRAAADVIGAAANTGGGGGNVSNISVTVPVTINGNADPTMGSQIGRAAAVELRRVLQLEARMA